MQRQIRRETLTYLICGGLTAAINYAVLYLWLHAFGTHTALTGNAAAFVVATTFAYFTNKIFVFQSKSWGWKKLLREMVSFFGTRLFSFGIEELGLVAAYALRLDGVEALGFNGIFLAKIALSGVAMLINYFVSKFLVFRKSAK